MFGFKIVNMLLGIKLENQYAPSVPDVSGNRRKWLKQFSPKLYQGQEC